jgi:hypothetical protein
VLPTFTEQPADVLARAGQRVTFQASAGPAGVSYQWLANGQPLAGANGATLVLDGTDPARAGLYRVRVTTPGGASLDSRDALLELAATGATELGGLSAEKLADLFANDAPGAGGSSELKSGRAGFTSVSVGVSGTRFLNLAGSLSEPEDRVPCDVIISASRWMRFRTTAPGTIVRVATTNAAFDTVLAVFTNRFNPVMVACDDDIDAERRNSRVIFTAAAGVDYLLMVAVKGAGAGTCGLAWIATTDDVAVDPLGMDSTGLVDGHFTFRRVVLPGVYQLDRGPALEALLPLQRLRVRSGLLDFRDPQPATGDIQFYRFNLSR